MKKLITILMALLMIMPMAFAADLEPEVDAGVTPDSPFYGIDKWWDGFRIDTAKNLEEKSRLRLEVAEERLAEMKEMASQNKIQAMEQARERHQLQLRSIESNMQNIEGDEAKNMIQEKLQKHIMTLEQVKENAPEEAQEGLGKAIENSQRVFANNQLQISVQNRQSEYELQNKVQAGEVSIVQEKTQTMSGSGNGGSQR
jgi:hypothetical protein